MNNPRKHDFDYRMGQYCMCSETFDCDDVQYELWLPMSDKEKGKPQSAIIVVNDYEAGEFVTMTRYPTKPQAVEAMNEIKDVLA